MTVIRNPVDTLSHRLLSGGVLLGLTVMAVALYGHDPAGSTLLPPCPFRAATGGLLCPGCGSLRGLHQLLHGNLRQAIALNALMVLSLPLLAFLGLVALGSRRGHQAPTWARPRYLGWVMLVVICGWWLTRNLL